HKVTATGSTGFTFEFTGLPDGLTASGDTVSGTPTRAGTFPVTVKATDKDGYVVEKSQDIVIEAKPQIDLDLSALPNGKQGIDYGSHKVVATGSTGFTFEFSGLPDGLTASGDTVSGTPT
ncbi:putative Ig domain-containing protein, partial [Brucella pseudintermedia]